MKIFFKNFSVKIPNKAFLVSNLDIVVFFRKILQIDKFEGADFKYDSFSKFYLKNTQIKYFWSQV